MDQEKIGNFIKECRKNKNLTQEELGTFLGVSNRSISKYENGVCMPDVSLFKPLCTILNISINELLSGEHLSNDRYKEEYEVDLLNTIDHISKKNNMFNKIIILLVVLNIILSLYLYNTGNNSWISCLAINIVLIVYIFKNHILNVINNLINSIKQNNSIFGIVILCISFTTIVTALYYLNNIYLLIISLVLLIVSIICLTKEKSKKDKIIMVLIIITIYIVLLININYFIVVPNNKYK